MTGDSVPGKAGFYGAGNVERDMNNKWGMTLRVDGMKVLLTADQTLMSNHRQNEFFGFL